MTPQKNRVAHALLNDKGMLRLFFASTEEEQKDWDMDLLQDGR